MRLDLPEVQQRAGIQPGGNAVLQYNFQLLYPLGDSRDHET